MPRSPAATCNSHGRTVSSGSQVAFIGDASPRVRHSSATWEPRRLNAYSSAPRSADSWPGRAVTTTTLLAGGSGSPAGTSGTARIIGAVPRCRAAGWMRAGAADRSESAADPRVIGWSSRYDIPASHSGTVHPRCNGCGDRVDNPGTFSDADRDPAGRRDLGRRLRVQFVDVPAA